MALIELLSGVFHLLAGAGYLGVCLKHQELDVYALLALAMVGIGICLIVNATRTAP